MRIWMRSQSLRRRRATYTLGASLGSPHRGQRRLTVKGFADGKRHHKGLRRLCRESRGGGGGPAVEKKGASGTRLQRSRAGRKKTNSMSQEGDENDWSHDR